MRDELHIHIPHEPRAVRAVLTRIAHRVGVRLPLVRAGGKLLLKFRDAAETEPAIIHDGRLLDGKVFVAVLASLHFHLNLPR